MFMKKSLRVYFVLFLISMIGGPILLGILYSQNPKPVDSWLTEGYTIEHRISPQPTSFFQFGFGMNPIKVFVRDNVRYQEMSGFGAALTDSAAWLISNTNSTAYSQLMTDLFDPVSGIGISYLRIPIGSSDCALTWYTYDDTAPDLTDFSIDHDKDYILPVLHDALTMNPDLKIMGSPFSAPGWMKINNDLTDPTTKGLIEGTLAPEYFEMYANYLVKWIEAYKAEGVEIDTITLQNEPFYTPSDYPGMLLNETQQIQLVKLLGPKLESASLTTKILILDHNWDLYEKAITILDDDDARQYIDGVAWHGYSTPYPSQQSIVHRAYPKIGHYFTEVTGFKAAPNFHDNLVWLYKNIFTGSVQNWAKTALLWNLALDENGGPILRDYDDLRGAVTISQNPNIAPVYEVEYYAIGHMSKFVMPGAYRIKTECYSENLDIVSFINPNNSKTVVVSNSAQNPLIFDIIWNGLSCPVSIPAKSVMTLKWN